MGKQYNLYNFEASFRKYLLAGNTLPVSIKNYLSDLRHFMGWLITKLNLNLSASKLSTNEYQSPAFVASLLSKELFEEYQSYLSINNIPIKTINRRLSTMRKFCSFCIAQGWLIENSAKQVLNSKPKRSFSLENSVISEYKQFLSSEQQSKIDIEANITNIKNLLTI